MPNYELIRTAVPYIAPHIPKDYFHSDGNYIWSVDSYGDKLNFTAAHAVDLLNIYYNNQYYRTKLYTLDYFNTQDLQAF